MTLLQLVSHKYRVECWIQKQSLLAGSFGFCLTKYFKNVGLAEDSETQGTINAPNKINQIKQLFIEQALYYQLLFPTEMKLIINFRPTFLIDLFSSSNYSLINSRALLIFRSCDVYIKMLYQNKIHGEQLPLLSNGQSYSFIYQYIIISKDKQRTSSIKWSQQSSIIQVNGISMNLSTSFL